VCVALGTAAADCLGRPLGCPPLCSPSRAGGCSQEAQLLLASAKGWCGAYCLEGLYELVLQCAVQRDWNFKGNSVWAVCMHLPAFLALQQTVLELWELNAVSMGCMKCV
jgi:hypothetical protein